MASPPPPPPQPAAPIFRLFDGLTRCAPGDAAAVGRALAGVAPDATVLDAGCGRGADMPALVAAVPGGRVVAVDLAAPFIAHVRAAFPGVQAEVADMLDPPGGPFDAIWSGGAMYGPGVAECLAAWRAHLRPGGRVAFTELCWATAVPSPQVRAFWAAEYPAMDDVAALERTIAGAGYRLRDAFWLEPGAWAAYYTPIAARLSALSADPDPAMQSLCAAFATEIAVWHSAGADFGYRLTVVERV